MIALLGPGNRTFAEDMFDQEEAAIAYRERLLSASVEIHQKTFYQLRDRSIEQDRILKCDFDVDRLRYECHVGEDIWVSCVGCGTQGQHLAFFNGAMQAGNKPLIVLDSINNISRTMQLAHPRMFGMTPLPLDVSGRQGIDSYLTRTDRSEVVVGSDAVGDDQCQRVSFLTGHGSRVVIWICAAKGDSVVRIQERYRSDDGKMFEDSVQSQVEYHSASKLWFPSRIEFEKQVDEMLVGRETLVIRVNSLNEPISPETFSIASLPGLEAGTRVQKHNSVGPGEDLVWDGQKVSPTMRVPTPTASSNVRVRLLVGNILILLAFTLFLLYRKRLSHDH